MFERLRVSSAVVIVGSYEIGTFLTSPYSEAGAGSAGLSP